MYILEVYKDTWDITFYYVITLAFLIGAFWTYMRVFLFNNKQKKKQDLKENIIYNHTEDLIENNIYNNTNYKTKKNKKKK